LLIVQVSFKEIEDCLNWTWNHATEHTISCRGLASFETRMAARWSCRGVHAAIIGGGWAKRAMLGVSSFDEVRAKHRPPP